ncbi:MAG: 3-isopropylmalate dehydratase [Rhodospirillaceae bacterium]|nr:3-isopropylmalate dehydratase [Rhodospirillaceae bacterium]
MSGKAWRFGDEINSDLLAPGLYMKSSNEIMATHCLESVDPAFAKTVQADDIIVGGHNFGIGSAREQAALSLRILKVGAVLAESFARIFYRNALNFGVPCLFFPQYKEINAGDNLSVDAVAGKIQNLTSGKNYIVDPIPAHLMEMIVDGGLMPHLKKKLVKGKAA